MSDRIVALEAIAFGEDHRITPRDSMAALEALERVAPDGELPMAAMAVLREVMALGGDALNNELAGFMDPGYTEPELTAKMEREVERRAEGRFRSAVRRWWKRQGEAERDARRLAEPVPELAERADSEGPAQRWVGAGGRARLRVGRVGTGCGRRWSVRRL